MIGENCGVYLTHDLDGLHAGLIAESNRGREAFGIAGVGDTIDVLKAVGSPDSFSLRTLYRIFSKSYHTFLGHVRYATTGRKEIEQILQDAHPLAIGGEVHKRGDHLVIRDCRIVGVHNGQVNDEDLEGFEFPELDTGTDTEKLLRVYDQIGEKELMKRIPGAYTLIIADKGKSDIMALRDRTGIKPGVLGWKAGKYIVASEDGAFVTDPRIKFREELKPGYIYYISQDGTRAKPIRIVEESPNHCFFEYNYVSLLDSTLNGVRVRQIRWDLGTTLASELSREINPETVDYVTFFPESSEESAIRLADESKIPYTEVFYKRDRERAFQGSNKSDRESSIKRNLHLIPGIEEKIRGKVVAVVDDSLVRGNNSKRAAFLLNRVAKVTKGFLLSYTPEIGIIPVDGVPRGCRWGVDMPPEESDSNTFIARGRSLEQISMEIGLDVRYISLDGLLKVFEKNGLTRDMLCTYCVGGEHPFKKSNDSVELSIGLTE